MALTATEEALLRDLLAKQAQLIALANNETTITAKLGSTKATIDDLTAATTVADADLMIVRQGGVDKKLPVSVIKSDLVDLSSYAPLASPALTGTPTAPTASTGTNNTQLATTEFVQDAKPAEATQAEMEAGTEANVRSMSPLRVAQAIAALGESGLGDGQVWTDVKASRAYGVTYTNSTGRPIEVFVTNSGGSQLLKATVGSVVLGQQSSTYNTSTPRQCFSFVVPNGSTYKVDCPGTLEYWTELR